MSISGSWITVWKEKAARKGPAIILWAGLAALPLVYWPGAAVAYEVPRVWFFQRWVEVLVIVSLFNIRTLLAPRSIDGTLLKLLLLFVCTAVLSSIVGVDMKKSIAGNFWRADGLATVAHEILLAVFLLLWWKRSLWRGTAWSIALGALVTSAWAVVEGVRWNIFKDPNAWQWNGAIGVSFGNPVFLAGYLVVTLPVWAYLFHSVKKIFSRVAVLLFLLVQLSAIMLTKSFGGIAGIGLFILCWIWFFAKGKRRMAWIAIAGVIVFPGILGIVQVKLSQRQPIFIMAEGRNRIFAKAILAWTKRPILGWGWANFDYAFTATDWPYHFLDDAYVDNAHSSLLEMLTTTGIMGLAAYVALVGYAASALWRRRDGQSIYILWMLFLYLVHSQTNIVSINEEMVFWLIVGVSAANPSVISRANPSRY